MNINHISVSRSKCFDLCAQQYKFRYHVKLPSPIEEPFYFVYGTLVHKVAELYVMNKGSVPIGDIASDLLSGRVPIEEDTLCPELPEDYKKKFQKHLRAIQKLNDKVGWEGIVEHPFRYDLDPPHERMAVGFIDRLVLRGSGSNMKAFIIDYKTTKKGKWRVNSDTVKDDLQLRTYARVVQKEFGLPAESIKAALYYLEGENLVAAQYSEESLIEVEKELLHVYKRIEASDPDKVWGNVGWHCKNCDYNSVCQFYNPNATKGGEIVWDGEMETMTW